MDIFHRLYKNPYGLAAIRMAVAIAILSGLAALVLLLTQLLIYLLSVFGFTIILVLMGVVTLAIFYIGLLYEAKQDLDIE